MVYKFKIKFASGGEGGVYDQVGYRRGFNCLDNILFRCLKYFKNIFKT